MLTVLGTVAGGCIGWLISPPNPPRTSEYSGLNEFFETIFHLGGGLALGAVTGFLAGIAISVILVRRVRRATQTERASNA